MRTARRLATCVPEYGATIAIFPIDEMTLDYLRLTGREESRGQAGGGLREGAGPVPDPGRSGSRVLRIHRARSRATSNRALPGPRRPQDRVSLKQAKSGFQTALGTLQAAAKKPAASGATAAASAAVSSAAAVADVPAGRRPARTRVGRDRRDHELHEHLESQRDDRRGTAREEGGGARSVAAAMGEDQPGARLEGRHRVSASGRARQPYLDQLGFNLVGYGCTTCIGNSGPLPDDVAAEVDVAESGRGVGAERQSQFRRAHSAAGARQLPGVAAARRRVRARRPHDGGSHDRAARHRPRRPSRCICATSGRPSARSRKRCCARSTPRCSASSTPTCSAATSAGDR